MFVAQVCLDEMVPPTKIFHCVNGHHICETCKWVQVEDKNLTKILNFNQNQIRSGLNPLLCPKCRKTITGRASDMENFLKVIFCFFTPKNCGRVNFLTKTISGLLKLYLCTGVASQQEQLDIQERQIFLGICPSLPIVHTVSWFLLLLLEKQCELIHSTLPPTNCQFFIFHPIQIIFR